MKMLLKDAQGRWRNGVWILLFVLLFLASRALYRPLADGLRLLGVDDSWMQPLGAILVLGITWICVRMRREALRDVGLGLDRLWLALSGIGVLAGAASVLLAVAIMLATGAVQWRLDPQRDGPALVAALNLLLWAALLEELLFRGFLFQRLVAGIGFPAAQFAVAALFAFGHWSNPDMEGMARTIATFEIGLGSILLGLAWRRTGSLALPIGLHLGWNVMQGPVLGFDVSGFAQPGWFEPVFGDAPRWLSGGAFGLEASACAIAADLVMIALLWRWKGSTPSRARATARIAQPL